MYQYLLGKVSTEIKINNELSETYQYLLGKVSTFGRQRPNGS